jgi:hypothetical protein
VAAPGIANLLFVFDDQLYDAGQIPIVQLVVPRKLDLGLDPELQIGDILAPSHPVASRESPALRGS